ncbi:MAG: N-acetylmuramoyl-L-alanine amidase [Patescibacteria group bacterium]|nr:N-acetylmuramoyl-L-alanine amidase [Patescibacteria group bacterium]
MAQNNSRGFIAIILLAIVAFFLVVGLIIAAIAIPGMIKKYYTFDKVLGGGTNTASADLSGDSSAQSLQYAPDPTAVANCLNSYIKKVAPNSYLLDKGLVFANAGKQYNVNPGLMIAIGRQESSLGTNGIALDGGYNYYGLTDNNDFTGWKRFSTADLAINHQASYLRSGYFDKNLTTIAAIGGVFAPIGAANDPKNLNKNWVTGVTNFFQELLATCPELQNQSKLTHIYIHWSGGSYSSASDHYHFNINGEGKLLQSGEPTDLKDHTSQRNTGAIGVAVDAMAGASLECYKDIYGTNCASDPITKTQMDTLYQLIADLSKTYSIPIDADHVMTHAEAAKLDGYLCGQTPESDCRWDFIGYGDIIRQNSVSKLGQ